MTNIIKAYKLPFILLIFYGVIFVVNHSFGFKALKNSSYYLIEMVQILPVIFMLTVAIDVLIPKTWIVKRLGTQSGLQGSILALIFGSLSAGPIYAAFPIAKTLHRKGASIGNLVIILSSWAVVKVPMLANEVKFLGADFMILRWILTVIFIFIMAIIMEKSRFNIPESRKVESPDLVMINPSIHIHQASCIGCTLCVKSMPEYFAMKQHKAYVLAEPLKGSPIPKDVSTQLNTLASQCPTSAIKL